MKENNPMNSAENRNKISLKLKGKPKSEEHKKNMYRPMSDPAVSSKRKGLGHPLYDHTIYHFKNKLSNEEIFVTRHTLIQTYSLNKGNVCGLLKGTEKSVKGWTLIKEHAI